MTDLEQPAEPVIVRLPAEIDTDNAKDAGEQLRSAFTPGVTIVIADMTSTVFCDSAGAPVRLRSLVGNTCSHGAGRTARTRRPS